MTHQPNRRTFLPGKAVADTPTQGALPETPFVYVSRKAMATEFELRFPDVPGKNFTELAVDSLQELEKVEEQLSFFRHTSAVGRINLLADKQPIEVEAELFELLELSLRLFRETGGAWDMTAAPLWQVWGFAKRKGRIPSADEIEEARQSVGSQFVELDAERKTIFFTRPGVKLNFGSLGKGYAIDRCAARLAEGGMTDFLLHGGQSSILARNKKGSELFKTQDNCNKVAEQSNALKNSSDPFLVGVPHPFCGNRRVGEIRLVNRALGTSNSRFQSFRHEGKLFGHILDPRTGVPAEGVLSVTVLAPTATLADALSTAFYVLGAEKSLDYCSTHPEIAAILLLPTPETNGCRVLTSGLAEGEFSEPK